MFDVLVESRSGRGRAARRASLPFAFALHALAVGALLAGSMLALRQVSDPEGLLVPSIVWTRFEPGPAPRLGDGGSSRDVPPATPVASPPRSEIVQPVRVEPLPPSTPTPDVVEDAPSGFDGLGIDGGAGLGPGVPWGLPDGVGDGPPGGAPQGTVSSAAPSDPVPLEPDMVPPRLVARVRPEYPAIALRAHLTGNVVLQAVIAEDGSVEDVQVLRASSPVFTDAAVDAVRAWRYRPALQNGRPVKVYFTVRVEFQLD